MSDTRAVLAALVLSLALHAGLAATLRGLGFGPEPVAKARDLPPLFVDLGEPIVAVSSPASRATPSSPSADRAARPAARPPAPRPAPRAEPPAPTPEAPVPVESGRPPAVEPPRPPDSPAPLPGAPAPPASDSPAAAPIAPADPTPAPEPAGASGGGPRPDSFESAEAGGTPVASGADPTPATSPAAADTGPRAAGGSAGSVPTRADPERASAATSGGEGGGAASASREEIAALPGGHGAAIPPEYDTYVRALRRRIQERLVYPWLAIRQRVQGTVELEIRIGVDGRLAGVSATSRESPAVLREAAVRAVRDATPLAFPSGLMTRALTIRLPVVFELQ
jgi:TonB family protein